jgi:hypothetical protein
MAGREGAAGPSGAAGMQGPTGPTGAQGAAGIVGNWTAYRDFTFGYDRTNIRASDASMASEIAMYMARNPSLQLGIDNSMNPEASQHSQDMNGRRASAVRDALIQAGVPGSRIQMGAFAAPQDRHARQVEVLLSTRT